MAIIYKNGGSSTKPIINIFYWFFLLVGDGNHRRAYVSCVSENVVNI
jgi:hypothetical protein